MTPEHSSIALCSFSEAGRETPNLLNYIHISPNSTSQLTVCCYSDSGEHGEEHKVYGDQTGMKGHADLQFIRSPLKSDLGASV